MSAKGIRAGRAFVEIGTDQTLFDRGIKAVRASMQRLSASAATIGRSLSSGFGSASGALKSMAGGLLNFRSLIASAVGAAGLGMLAKTFANTGSELADMSARTGVAADELSALGYAAKMTGSDMGAVEKAIRKMQQSGQGIAGATATQSLMAYADQIAAIQDPAKQTEMAIKLFGKSGASLLPMLKGGSAGLQDMADEAERLGLIMSAEDVAAADELGDTMDKLSMAGMGVVRSLGAALAPTLIELSQSLINTLATASQFVNENRDLIASLFSVSTYTTLASNLFQFLAESMAYLVPVSAGVTESIADGWSGLMSWISPIIDGVGAALMSGQWAAAGKIAMLGLEQAIRVGTQPIYDLWTDLYSTIAIGAINAVTAVANTFAGIPTTIVNAFGTAITWLTGAWDQTVNWIAKKLLYLYSLFDKSIDYAAAAKGMDADASRRAAERQRSLDAANARRNQELATANAARNQLAQGMTSGIRDQANARKSEFDARIDAIGNEIATTLEQVNREAAARQAAREYAKQKQNERRKPLVPELPNLQMAMGDAQKAVGTFSGFGAGLAGGGGVNNAMQSMVKHQATANKLLTQIADNTEDMGDDSLEFGA
jgi:hypothetical protein